MSNQDKLKLLEQLKDKFLFVPTRIEQLGGQNYKYIRLEEVLDILEQEMGGD